MAAAWAESTWLRATISFGLPAPSSLHLLYEQEGQGGPKRSKRHESSPGKNQSMQAEAQEVG